MLCLKGFRDRLNGYTTVHGSAEPKRSPDIGSLQSIFVRSSNSTVRLMPAIRPSRGVDIEGIRRVLDSRPVEFALLLGSRARGESEASFE